jgi:hypothetical protein
MSVQVLSSARQSDERTSRFSKVLKLVVRLSSIKMLAKAAEKAKAEMNAIIDIMSLLLIAKSIMTQNGGKVKIIFKKLAL